jgi:enoyl-CoA hydratase/2-(1,2-epoxy-1,2-dihydrophenyl)acetyl-CoA isomerase
VSKDPVLSEARDGVLTITLNRPEAMNALNQPLFEALNREIYRARFDGAVRVVVVQGAGAHFCVGVDMDYIEKCTEASLAHRTFANLDFVHHLVRMGKPVVAKVSGNAIGAGLSLAVLADFVVAAEDAVFQMPFTRLGAVIDMGSSFMLPRLVGLARAKAIGMLGERLSGTRAAEWGLVYQSVKPASLDAAVDALVGQLLKLSPEAVGLTKQGLEQALGWNIEQAVDWETTQQSRLIPGDYVQAQVKAFRARKRGP